MGQPAAEEAIPPSPEEPIAQSAGGEAPPLLLRIILAPEENDDPLKSGKCTAPTGLRHLSLTTAVQSLSTYELLRELEILDGFRRTCDNLYQRVRALFFLYAVHRFHLPGRRNAVEKEGEGAHDMNGVGNGDERRAPTTVVCKKGYVALLDRRFGEAIDHFLASVPLSPSTIAMSPDKCGKESGPGSKMHAVPQRTSLVSDLNCFPELSRHDSAFTDRTTNSSFYQYSEASSFRSTAMSLDGEHLLSSTVSSVNGSAVLQSNRCILLPSDATSSALAKAYRELAFQTLADQVKSSVRSHPGNEWMFQLSSAKEHPLQWRDELLGKDGENGPMLLEKTPVRMDLSHSCWSDIFFLGMDFPESARVVNCSVDLAVMQTDGEGATPTPPIECRLQLATDNPGTIRLTSVDLGCSVVLTHVKQVFDYGADYVGLLKAGIVAGGIVPPSLEEDAEENASLKDLLSAMMPGCNECPYGLELTTNVHGIPKGSRLAVSTNLLGSIIAVCMRATGQTTALTGTLLEPERRLVAARAILGEWLGGSGGGWQDSGGVWPGLKLIHGVTSREGDPEFGVSRGRLLPQHKLLSGEDAPEELLHALEKSLVLVHGGMAQNVGPILEMVTEKYLLREEEEWIARHRAMEILDDLLIAFRKSDIKAIAQLVTENFFGPIRAVIPWASNLYTETLIGRVQERFGDNFWGFWMLGGMSGGGMGFIFDPDAKSEALAELGSIMLQTKKDLASSLPFAMDPVVFDYRVNERGTFAELRPADISSGGGDCKQYASQNGSSPTIQGGLEELLKQEGFDVRGQEQIRADLQNGVIGLAKNRLSPESILADVVAEDVLVVDDNTMARDTRQLGVDALASGSVGVVTLAAGVGSRWTQGAGVVKALHPYCCIGGKHRTFLDVHLAKNRKVSAEAGTPIPHVVTTSWMTDAPIAAYVNSLDGSDETPIYISKGTSIGLRMIPMVRDLKFLWEEQSRQRLDEQAEKVRDSVHSALMGWAESNGEGSDYRDNEPKQCLSPVGHWYEIPNLLLNGTLAKMLRERPQLQTLMLHNIDTIGADVDAAILGKFLETRSTLAFEVVPRCIDDMGGGLCRVDGKPRLVEGLALPTEDDELKFSYYNSLTTWIDIDKLLDKFGLDRNDILEGSGKIAPAIDAFSRRLPTYVTIKEVKKRWGKGQEDVHPVAQSEKLWGDLSSVDGVECSYFVVSRQRGQQLKDPAQLDGWSRDGSAAYLDSICSW
ncbi:hypothetical protein ACHAXT_013196 [Thalassiosira profunda]